jgi:hypothetical protein
MAAKSAIASITMDLRVQPRTRRKPSRGSTHCARNPVPPREAMVDFGMST